MNSEMLKLVLILGIGLPVGIVGQFLIIKRKNAQKAKQEQLYSQQYGQSDSSAENPSELSKKEETARNYISQYKSQYPRESIKQGLLNYGIEDTDAEKYLEKYF